MSAVTIEDVELLTRQNAQLLRALMKVKAERDELPPAIRGSDGFAITLRMTALRFKLTGAAM